MESESQLQSSDLNAVQVASSDAETVVTNAEQNVSALQESVTQLVQTQEAAILAVTQAITLEIESQVAAADKIVQAVVLRPASPGQPVQPFS
jgi:hypothetical protein